MWSCCWSSVVALTFSSPLLRRPSPHLFASLFHSMFSPSLHPYLWCCFLDSSSGYVAASCESWYSRSLSRSMAVTGTLSPQSSRLLTPRVSFIERRFKDGPFLTPVSSPQYNFLSLSPFRFSSFSPSPQFFLFLLERVSPALFTHGLHTSCVLSDYWFHLQPWFIHKEYTFFVWFIIRFLSFFCFFLSFLPSRTIRYIYENSIALHEKNFFGKKKEKPMHAMDSLPSESEAQIFETEKGMCVWL